MTLSSQMAVRFNLEHSFTATEGESRALKAQVPETAVYLPDLWVTNPPKSFWCSGLVVALKATPRGYFWKVRQAVSVLKKDFHKKSQLSRADSLGTNRWEPLPLTDISWKRIVCDLEGHPGKYLSGRGFPRVNLPVRDLRFRKKSVSLSPPGRHLLDQRQ